MSINMNIDILSKIFTYSDLITQARLLCASKRLGQELYKYDPHIILISLFTCDYSKRCKWKLARGKIIVQYGPITLHIDPYRDFDKSHYNEVYHTIGNYDGEIAIYIHGDIMRRYIRNIYDVPTEQHARHGWKPTLVTESIASQWQWSGPFLI
jgi:hypothetical protein